VIDMWTRLVLVAAMVAAASPALAEDAEASGKPAAAKARVPRRAEKLDQERSVAERSKRKVHQIDTVYVYARPQRPIAAVETSTKPFQFPVGTARYSERDRRFLKSSRGERW
jgi:hypothetical protein